MKWQGIERTLERIFGVLGMTTRFFDRPDMAVITNIKGAILDSLPGSVDMG